MLKQSRWTNGRVDFKISFYLSILDSTPHPQSDHQLENFPTWPWLLVIWNYPQWLICIMSFQDQHWFSQWGTWSGGFHWWNHQMVAQCMERRLIRWMMFEKYRVVPNDAHNKMLSIRRTRCSLLWLIWYWLTRWFQENSSLFPQYICTFGVPFFIAQFQYCTLPIAFWNMPGFPGVML